MPGPRDAPVDLARDPCSCRQTPVSSRYLLRPPSSAFRAALTTPGPPQSVASRRALKAHLLLSFLYFACGKTPQTCLSGARKVENLFFLWILYPISSCNVHPWFSGHEVLGRGGESEWDRAQLCLAFFLYFCKSISIIPKWPNRCHTELVKAQSHDSKEEGRPGYGKQPVCGCLGPKSPPEEEQSVICQECLQDGEKGILCLSQFFFKLKVCCILQNQSR